MLPWPREVPIQTFLAWVAIACSTSSTTTGPSASDSAASTGDGGADTGACETTARVDFDWECTLNTDPDVLPDCAAAPTHPVTTGTYNVGSFADTCEQRRVWTINCCEDFSEISQAGLIYEGMTFLQEPWRYPVLYIQTAEEWAAVLADDTDPWTEDLPEIDFDSQMLMVVQDWENDTCGFDVKEHGLLVTDSGPPPSCGSASMTTPAAATRARPRVAPW